MARRWLLGLAAVPMVELGVLIVLARAIGWGGAVVVTLISSATGLLLVRRSWRQWWEAMNSEGGIAGIRPGRIGEGALLLLGTAWIVTPGPLTGLVGVLLQIPRVRRLVARMVVRWAVRRWTGRIGRF